jgi:hypothetical protein
MSNTKPGCLAALFGIFGQKQKPNYTVTTTIPDEPEILPYFLRDDFISPAEASFYHVLQNLVQGKQIIFPKVGLGGLFYVSQPDKNFAFINKINRKHVDFLLCDPNTLKPTLAIELDDSSHSRPSRASRDDFVDEVFATANLPLVRIPAQMTYNTQELALLLKDAFTQKRNGTIKVAEPELLPVGEPPVCPKCGAQMVLRKAQRGPNVGQEFYGCPHYPKCREVVAVTWPAG